MAGGAAELANELKTLRKGRGLQTPKLSEQVGPTLRQLCGITGTENSATIREKLSERLRNLADGLPDDLRLAVTVALAIHPETQQQFLQERVQFLAEMHQRDVRTIRRRMDDGFELLAEMATKPSEQRGGTGLGWYIERVEGIMRLDKAAPESFERRTIVAEWDSLDTIQAMMTLPRDSAHSDEEVELLAELYFGAKHVGTRRTGQRFVYDLLLPEPLAIGERHEYGMIFRVTDEQQMRRHYVMFPDRRCEEFTVRVRFDPEHMPKKVWRVSEVFHRDVDDMVAPETLLTIDKAGEINLSFHSLLPGHGYGAQWEF